MEKINHLFLDIGEDLHISNPTVAAIIMTLKSDLKNFKERLSFDMSECRRCNDPQCILSRD